jgi:hypothetical protein
MSLNVLVVPENPTYNGAILKPFCERLFVECGKTQARIEVMANPRTNGYAHAKGLFPDTILDLYSHKHPFFFCRTRTDWIEAPNLPKWKRILSKRLSQLGSPFG